jgi:hypothetical protein
VHSGTTNAPNCVLAGFTGETNNLTLVGTPAVGTGPAPAIVFNQSNVAGAPASCAGANSTGEPHLRTFGGLLYDFQASGDFVLVESDNGFVVQARQVSLAPHWPNLAINKAVGTRIGKTSVAVCLDPVRLTIDGKTADLEEGETLTLPDLDVVKQGTPTTSSVKAETACGRRYTTAGSTRS